MSLLSFYSNMENQYVVLEKPDLKSRSNFALVVEEEEET